ncbi:MAG: DUF1294 domain-containing protein [Clostridiales bacterium]|nr:DUF1294 domain-containing protein [Clostridiales bacterium]
MNRFVIFFLLLINFISFIFMYIDKQKAIHKKWRIKESTLIGLAVLGGSIGMLLGMYTFRHKTKHPLFYIGGPTILILQIIIVVWFNI